MTGAKTTSQATKQVAVEAAKAAVLAINEEGRSHSMNIYITVHQRTWTQKRIYPKANRLQLEYKRKIY